MADEIDILLGIRAAQIADDGLEVFQLLGNCQPGRIGGAVEGTPGAALVEIRHEKVTLEIAVEIAKQRPLWAARPSMQPEQQRCASHRPADFDIELSITNLDLLCDSDRVSANLSQTSRREECAHKHKDTNRQHPEAEEASGPRIRQTNLLHSHAFVAHPQTGAGPGRASDAVRTRD